ncbi:MAG: hypothetical protein GYA24_21050 [Candidatus Lokiarchaeota archaeon]|nr:hypothetical protein [Candidatus Lokiarchaeota archaeon]
MTVNDALVRQRLGPGAERVLKSQRNQAIIEAAKRELAELARPAAAWATFPVKGISHDKLVLENGVKIGGGPVTKIMCGAAELVAGVCTIGPHMEQKARECIDAGDSFHGLVLDLLASWAAGSIREQLVLQLQHDHYRAKGWHASIHMGPGESAFPVTEQRVIFDLLGDEVARIGVRLEPTMLMVPIKSVSFILGAGPNPLGQETGSQCEYCDLRDTCKHRGKH